MLIRSTTSRIAVTVALPVLALLACELLRPWLDPTYDPVFIAANAILAWLCGPGYACAGVLLSALALDYFFLPPYNSFELLDANLRVKFFLFLGANTIVIALIHYAKRSHEAVAEADQRYRSFTELIPFGGWISDKHGNKITLDKDGITVLSGKDLTLEAGGGGNVVIKGAKVDVK